MLFASLLTPSLALFAVLLTLAVLPADAAVPPGCQLTWSEEFAQPLGSPPDKTRWSYDTGSNGWGNNEMQNYVSDTLHAQIVADPDAANGTALQILATSNGQGIKHGNFQSARLLTQNKFTFQYGYIEARLRMPYGQGIWPAFWLLGANISESGIGWPSCGELDIMESKGSKPGWNASSLHGPGYSGSGCLTGEYNLPAGQKFRDKYHTFGLLWKRDFVQFSVDSVPFETRTPADIPGKTWAYNHPFFVIVNVAVGGNFSGSPDTTTVFPQKMLIDYIRVYQPKP